MQLMPSAAHGRFHWNELLTTDTEAAKKFYSTTMGWVYDEMKMPGGGKYYVAIKGNDPVAGLMEMPTELPAGTPSHWMSYVEVDDIDEAVAKAKSAGGTVLQEAFEVADVGTIVVVKDPTGGVIGWIKPDFND
jgi:predicted enzyme related to lactoylglutathione lyase